MNLEERLWEAVIRSDEDQVKELLLQGTNVNFQKEYSINPFDPRQETVLSVALINEPINKRIIQMLLDAGANPDTKCGKSICGSTITESAFTIVIEKVLRGEDTELIEMFLSKRPDVSFLCIYEDYDERMWEDRHREENVIHRATRHFNAKVVKLLLEHGAKVDAIAQYRKSNPSEELEFSEESPLHIICGMSQESEEVLEIVHQLLKYGANPNLKLRKYQWTETPLHVALRNGSSKIALMLMDHGGHCSIPWVSGLETIPCTKFMDGEVVARLWETQSHLSLLPTAVRNTAKTILLCARRLQWPFPKEIVYQIITYSLLAYKSDETIKREKDRERFMRAQQASRTNQPSQTTTSYCTIS